MAHIIQVEIKTGTTYTVTWLDAALKPKPGMALVCHRGAGSEGHQCRLESCELRGADRCSLMCTITVHFSPYNYHE